MLLKNMTSITSYDNANTAVCTSCLSLAETCGYLDIYFASGEMLAKDITQPLTAAMDGFVRGLVLYVAKKSNIPYHCVKLVWPCTMQNSLLRYIQT